MKCSFKLQGIVPAALETARKRTARLARSRTAGLALFLALCPAVTVLADVLTTDTIGSVEVEIRRAGEGTYPLVIFSHGMGGCPGSNDGILSALADRGFIVVAPKHEDCISGSTTPDVAWSDPSNWTDLTNSDRRDDIHAVLDALPYSNYAQYVEDFERVGCMGYSMGGYTCMGLAGAWSTWTRDEIRTVAALSPWHRPYLIQDRVGGMTNDQTLYQGGTRDIAITPQLIQSNGTYDQTWTARYVQVFEGAGHFAWRDGILGEGFHSQMSHYIGSFFDAYLKNGSTESLEAMESLVSTLDFEHDTDGDRVGDSIDNCPLVANPDQTPSTISPGQGQACEDLPPGC